VNGVRVWKTYRQDSGLPYLRFFYPRLYSNWRALVNADADIYFQSCAGLMTGVVAKFAARYNRKMIFRVAHDADCVPGEQLVKNSRDRVIYEYGLQRADLISVQSKVQADALKKNYGLDTTLVNMIAEMPVDEADISRDIDVLWVNNFRAFKRPELVCEIARRMPDVSFTMIGGKIRAHEDLYRRVEKEARELPNLNFVGPVPYREINAYFSRAKVFLNTSDSEGFPNSFLQALVRRVPVTTYFDPDGLIESNEMGVAVASQDDFHVPLQELLQADERRREMGERGRQFVMNHYSPAAIVDDYEDLVADRCGVRQPSG
jgi:glycosyltransferase involved in cell wall biosynthesis